MSELRYLSHFEMSLVMSSGVQVKFQSGSYRHENGLNMSGCGSFSEVYIQLTSFRERKVLV